MASRVWERSYIEVRLLAQSYRAQICLPYWTMAIWSNDKVNSRTLLDHRIRHVISRLRTSHNDNILCVLQLRGFLAEILRMEPRSLELFLVLVMRHIRSRSKARRNDELLSPHILGLLVLRDGKFPGAARLIFDEVDFGVELDLVKHTEMLSVVGKISMQGGGWNMLIWLHGIGSYTHWKVWILVRADHVI